MQTIAIEYACPDDVDDLVAQAELADYDTILMYADKLIISDYVLQFTTTYYIVANQSDCDFCI